MVQFHGMGPFDIQSEIAERISNALQAEAYARLSRAHSLMYWFHFDRSDERLRRAKQAADRSLELQPDLPAAHEALGWYYYWYWGHFDYETAREHLETALSREPGNTDIHRGIAAVERRRGNFQAAPTHFEKAVELNPRDALQHQLVAQTHRLLRNYAAAERHYDHALALSPDLTGSYGFKAWLYIAWKGSTSEARAVLEEATRRGLDPVDPGYAGYRWVLLDIFEGEYEAALGPTSATTPASRRCWSAGRKSETHGS